MVPLTWRFGDRWGPKGALQRLGRWSEKFQQSEAVMGLNPDFKDLLSELSDRNASVSRSPTSVVPENDDDPWWVLWRGFQEATSKDSTTPDDT